MDAAIADMDSDAADALEKRFFNQLVLANGTLKTTFARRLTDVDALCNEYLRALGEPVRLLDVAVSSGITTWEWVQALDAAGIDFELDAFDLCVDASIVSLGERLHVLCDSGGRPLQFEVSGRTIENTFGETWGRRLRRALPVTALRAWFALRSGSADSRTPVQLVTRHLREPGRIRVFEHDLQNVRELESRYAMIRTANILNLAYFDRRFLEKSIADLASRLLGGGYLCIVRTHHDGSNHGTLFQRTEAGLKVVARIGDGSEVEAEALGDTVTTGLSGSA